MNDHPRSASQEALPPPKPWRAIALAVILLAVVVAGLWFWRASRGGGPGYTPPGAIDVVAATVKAEPAPASVEALGELRAVRQVTLASEVAGRITAISFEPGQRVKTGTVLVQLDDSTEQADLAAARAGAAFAEQQWKRAGELASTGATSREVLQQRQSERDRTAAQVRQLEARLRKMRVRAPFAGELGLRQVDLGQYLNPGDKAVTLTDLDTLHVNFDVPQQELARLRVGQRVEVRSDTPGAAPLEAKVTAIEPQVGRDTRNATVQALLANPKRTLRPGMYVTVAVALPDEPDALLVPATAIITSASGDTAAVVRELSAQQAGKAEIVPIVAGRRIGDRVVVAHGLKAGDVVVTEGQLRLQPGAAVRIVEKPAPGSAPAADAASPAGR
ncbi:MAG: efflux RND transporter periplasmic adaptor subunit [Burkholderiales bacterium]|nr:efflux RND transporter periplasmic adaptor subunit [Burkholderiales bacterium]OJX06589.1 MAG: efflux transporter periplasmic adaptor subunit [Burkholderiales bacterium 70-64]